MKYLNNASKKFIFKKYLALSLDSSVYSNSTSMCNKQHFAQLVTLMLPVPLILLHQAAVFFVVLFISIVNCVVWTPSKMSEIF